MFHDVEFVPYMPDTGDAGTMLAWPYYGLNERETAVIVDRVPAGEIEIRRGDALHASDGGVGRVEGLVVAEDGHITHLVLEEGHLWHRKDVAVPVGSVERIDADGIHVASLEAGAPATCPSSASSARTGRPPDDAAPCGSALRAPPRPAPSAPAVFAASDRAGGSGAGVSPLPAVPGPVERSVVPGTLRPARVGPERDCGTGCLTADDAWRQPRPSRRRAVGTPRHRASRGPAQRITR